MTDAAAKDSNRVVDRQAVLKRLMAAIAIDEPACNVLLAGPWGSGKTTLLQQLKETLKKDLQERPGASNQAPAAPHAGPAVATATRRPLWPVQFFAKPVGGSPQDDSGSHRNPGAETLRDYYLIEFSPWNQLGDEDPREGFLKLLGAEVLQLKRAWPDRIEALDDEARSVWEAVCKFASDMENEIQQAIEKDIPGGHIAWIMFKFVRALCAQKAALEQKHEDALKAVTTEPGRRRDQMYKLLGAITKVSQTKRILLLVEDLDRTRPEYAVGILEALYHLLLPGADAEHHRQWPLTSIWAVNITMLEEFLYAHYRDQPSFDATAYLEKLFHWRINVPPLFHPETAAGVKVDADSSPSPAARLWKADLDRAGVIAPPPDASPTPRLSTPLETDENREYLARGLSYAVLGNLRLYAAVRRLCIQYWKSEYGKPEQANPGSDHPVTQERLVRDARLMTLIHAFPGFREDIALYSGMWPEFINRVNERRRRVSFEAVRNPAYRHVDDPNLLTLLVDLDVLTWDERAGLYRLDRQGEERLARDLGELLRAGF